MKNEMKKNLFMVAAVALMALVSCNKEKINDEVQEVPVSNIVFEAVTPQTRTSIGEVDANGACPVSWVIGDKITINGSEFTATSLEENKAIFTETNTGFAEAEIYDAIYPATAGKSLNAVTIAAKQDGTFANASVAVAQSETRSLQFKNLASMLKFQVPVACSSVTIESTANLAGTVSVTFDEEGNPVLGEVSNASKSITIEKSFATGTDYYVAVLPGEHKFTVKMESVVAKASTKTVTLSRAQIGNLKTLDRPNVNVYILASHLSWSKANILVDNKSTAMITATVSGRSYFKASVPFNTTANIKFNSGGTTGSYWMVQVGNDNEKITIGSDKYYRISPRGPVEIIPTDESTFGYSIFVFDQKSKNQAPNLYVWEDNSAFKNQYGGNFSSWPGVVFKNDSYYKPANNQNWKHYYYYEIPTSLYGKSFKFIVNKSGQTSDLVVTKLDGDLYVGYWYDSASSNGFWSNSNLSTPITQ